MAHPTLGELILIGQKCGIDPSDSEALWHKWEGNGWKNGGKAIVSVAHTMAAWKAYGYLPSQVRDRQNGKGRAPTAYTLKTVMDAKQAEAVEIRRRYTVDVATGTTWQDSAMRQRYVALIGQVRQIRSQLGELAL